MPGGFVLEFVDIVLTQSMITQNMKIQILLHFGGFQVSTLGLSMKWGPWELGVHSVCTLRDAGEGELDSF